MVWDEGELPVHYSLRRTVDGLRSFRTVFDIRSELWRGYYSSSSSSPVTKSTAGAFWSLFELAQLTRACVAFSFWLIRGLC